MTIYIYGADQILKVPESFIGPAFICTCFNPWGCKELDMTQPFNKKGEIRGILGDSVVKNLPANAGALGWEDFLEKGIDPLQYYCLENPLDGGAWQATVHGVTKSWIRLSD